MTEVAGALLLGDLQDMSDDDLRTHVVDSYEADRAAVDKYDFLIAYESVGSWGCDSSSFFLMRSREDGALFETHGSHCSCHGFEGQFEPEATTPEYLRSDRFYFSTGGYDEDSNENHRKVREYIAALS